MKIGAHEYRLTVGSDVERDGMFLEADLVGAPERRTVMEVFYSDATREFTVSLFEEDLPAELVEFMIHDARKRLPPMRRTDG